MSTSRTEKLIFAPGENANTNTAAQFTKGALEANQLTDDPLSQFNTWFKHASENGVYVPETCCLSTAELPSGKVSSRFVYLKELDSKGFVIYLNWGTSRKAADIESNPHAALVFWWRELERQVRIEGTAERLTAEESQIYYDTRARGSRIGAWASQQSSVLQGREELEQQVRDVEKKFEGVDMPPVPDFWGGLRVVPEVIEFWQGRDSRLHDRFRFVKEAVGQSESGWKMERLSP